MEILDIANSWRDGIAEARIRVRSERQAQALELWYRFEGVECPLQGLNEMAAVALIVPAMFEGEPIRFQAGRSRAGLSATLMENLADAQEVLASWYGHLRPVNIDAPVVTDGTGDGAPEGVACCFSGGVDSWYSVLKNQSRISHLLLVRGFDIGLANDVLWKAARARAAHAADNLGKRLITCTTNLRDIADKARAGWGTRFDGDFWGRCLHGAALASVGLALRRTVGEMIVPATDHYTELRPWGSSPLLDRLWSDGHVRIRHDGSEAYRLEKVRRLSRSDLALQTLRVCYHDTPAANCGRCEKCLRTMMALRLCGALDRATTFPRRMSMREVHALMVPPHVRNYYVGMCEEARRIGDEEIVRAVEILLNRRFSLRQELAWAKCAFRDTELGRTLHRWRRQVHPAEPASA